MLIDNLSSKLLKASELQVDSRFRSWARMLDSVDPAGKDGYAFSGEYAKNGTTELQITKPVAVLCAAESGSRKSHDYAYAVVVLEPDGNIIKTEIETNGARGWALRIRDETIALMDSLAGTITVEPHYVQVSAKAEDALTAIATMLTLDESEVVAQALAHYLAHLQHTDARVACAE